MMMTTSILLIALTTEVLSSDIEVAIHNQIFQNYETVVRPVLGEDFVTSVNVTLNYFALLTLDQKGELMTFAADVQKSWFDKNLRWNATQFGNVSRILVAETSVWRPDIAIVNQVDQAAVIALEDRYAAVFSDGTVQVSVPGVYTTRCTLALSAFPFDSQRCKLKFGSWVYTADELVIEAAEELAPGAAYKGNSEWTVESIAAAAKYAEESDGRVYEELQYTFTLRRKSSYYVYVLFLPTFIVSTLAICGLFTPLTNEGCRAEKASLGLTTLLSLAVMLDIVGADMPKSAPLPRLARYVLAEIIVCSLGVLASIAIQLCHQRINTREFIVTRRHKFPATEPDRLGMRVLASSQGYEFRSALSEFEKCLKSTSAYIDCMELRDDFLQYWIKFFDVVDLSLLVLFQTANVILTLAMTLA